jgi:hypothetical protein
MREAAARFTDDWLVRTEIDELLAGAGAAPAHA